MGKPPYCEVIFKSVADVSTPPDLTATISFDDFLSRSTNTFTISRAAEKPFECQLHNLYNLIIIIVVAVGGLLAAIDDIDLGKYTILLLYQLMLLLQILTRLKEFKSSKPQACLMKHVSYTIHLQCIFSLEIVLFHDYTVVIHEAETMKIDQFHSAGQILSNISFVLRVHCLS